MKKLFISDDTLRRSVQEGGADLLFREKKAIAACLDRLGVDQIDLPPVVKEKEDRIIFRTIAAAVSARVAIPAGLDEHAVDLAWECVREAARPCLQILLPVTTVQMEYAFRSKEEAMLERIRTLVSLARARCDCVEFCALDAGRADPAFLLRACLAARESGAGVLTLYEDTGCALPEEVAAMVASVRDGCALPVLVCLSDRIGMAPACAAAAFAAGADGVRTAMAGSDILTTERLAALLRARGEDLGVSCGLDVTQLHSDIAETLRATGHEDPLPAPGERSASDIFLDAESTLSDVCEAAAALGYTLSAEDSGSVYQALRQVCEHRTSLGEREFEALIASHAMQAPSTYHLVSYTASCTSIGTAMAQVVLSRGEEALHGVASGDGPIDAAFRAIEQSVGHHYELDDFQIQSVTEGKEALGSALVRLRNDGRLYAGNGLSTDIVGASIRAYVNALNKIVFEEI